MINNLFFLVLVAFFSFLISLGQPINVQLTSVIHLRLANLWVTPDKLQNIII